MDSKGTLEGRWLFIRILYVNPGTQRGLLSRRTFIRVPPFQMRWSVPAAPGDAQTKNRSSERLFAIGTNLIAAFSDGSDRPANSLDDECCADDSAVLISGGNGDRLNRGRFPQ